MELRKQYGGYAGCDNRLNRAGYGGALTLEKASLRKMPIDAMKKAIDPVYTIDVPQRGKLKLDETFSRVMGDLMPSIQYFASHPNESNANAHFAFRYQRKICMDVLKADRMQAEVPPGNYRVTASADGYVSESTRLQLDDGESIKIQFALDPQQQHQPK